ncbi:SGNH hydrolase-like domain-containing protein, acetyltransferase AlgX [Butyrivibrio sp. ob235]|uniref:alginate O-acetyltransferase AlgX-related protein n=1 Tax=Butyrivibrio sp. ob235 TaxID=1761780 RepID=UPI0008B945C5|nr:hypothetical protein [Butyrivibrio sp. ob235]SEM26191.1 SGNH hydrolase-like domain-containing protein, acetyltransferase AlgX [Butyrivibrio sp. ob235]
MNKTKNYAFIAVFLLIVLVFGGLSYSKLVNFYINQELDYNEWTPELGSKFETDIASTFYNKVGFVNLNGAICNILKQPTMNGVVKLNNGYLLSPFKHTSDKVLGKYADSVVKLNYYLKNRGTVLVYANPPYTTNKYDPELPVGVEDYGNDNCDRFLQMLRDAGVDTIDLREAMHDDGIDHYSMMYKTDHHWTTEAGLYAYGVLQDYIVEKTGCSVDERIADIQNYTVTTYKKWHLGSNGQRTGIYYAGIDDFDLIVPNFETTIQNDEGVAGTMQDIILNKEPLTNKNYTSRYTYDNVLDRSLGNFKNLDCKNDIKVLTITDSYGKAVNPYLAMGFAQIDFVHDADVSVVTPEFIEEVDPDVVIMMYYPDCLQKKRKAFSFTGF